MHIGIYVGTLKFIRIESQEAKNSFNLINHQLILLYYGFFETFAFYNGN